MGGRALIEVAAAAAAGALAGPLLVAGLVVTGDRLAQHGADLAEALAGWLDAVVAPMRRAGAEGVVPTDAERLRLSLAFGVAGLAGGWWFGGIALALMAAISAAALSSRAVAVRRARYTGRLDEGVAGASLALADALSAGHSARGAIATAARSLDGPIALELQRTSQELAVGAGTDDALGRLRLRARSRRVDILVAAIRLQRRSGGNLAGLLRDVAAAAEEQAMLNDEARAATAQARFTSLTVISIGPSALVLAELAAPGTIGRIAGSAAGLLMLAMAGLLQVCGALMVRRLSRVQG